MTQRIFGWRSSSLSQWPAKGTKKPVISKLYNDFLIWHNLGFAIRNIIKPLIARSICTSCEIRELIFKGRGAGIELKIFALDSDVAHRPLILFFLGGGGLNTGTTNRYSTIIYFCKYFDGCTCTRTYMVLLFHISSTRLGIPLLHGTNLFSFPTNGKRLVMFK